MSYVKHVALYIVRSFVDTLLIRKKRAPAFVSIFYSFRVRTELRRRRTRSVQCSPTPGRYNAATCLSRTFCDLGGRGPWGYPRSLLGPISNSLANDAIKKHEKFSTYVAITATTTTTTSKSTTFIMFVIWIVVTAMITRGRSHSRLANERNSGGGGGGWRG